MRARDTTCAPLAMAREVGRAAAVALACWGLPLTVASAQSDAPPPPPIPALDIDPTEQIDVRGWWSNGRELLLIQADGSYRLWNGTNRFLAPDDIGRWDRQTYRTLWLETYRGQKHTRDRAHLRRQDGTLLLTVRDLQPMQPLTRPPHTREDTLVGSWSGPPGTLVLRDDGTYSFSVAKSDPKDRQPARLGSHSGTWLVRDDTLVLTQGDRMKPVTAAIVTPATERPYSAPAGTVAPAAAGAGGSSGGAIPAPSPASPAAPALPPHQLTAPEGTTIAMPGGALRRETPSGATAR